MNPRYDKLKRLLKELFQLDKPELDFGLYRIMHARSAEITRFLDEDLLPQVEEAFERYQSADRVEIEKELARAIAKAEELGSDSPESLPGIQTLRARLADEAVDVGGLEAEVYDHLYRFFRRYYSEGDFLSKRVYKAGVYAIPYEGEEVKLHWANADQYYTKTSEYLRDYAFRLRPEAENDPMPVHFRLVDAAEGEHGNIKEGAARVFVLAPGGESGHDFAEVQEGESGPELVLRFEYRPATMSDWPEEQREAECERLKNPKPPAQKDLNALAAARVLAASDGPFALWIQELGKPHVLSGGEEADYTRLKAHLRRYTARNTFDYFIHKDLGGFLRRELDFYIKNEVMHLDDIENDTVPRVEQYLSKIKVIRRIAGKIIDFLAQLEDFQKKLWLKKKIVVETSWCVRVGCIPRGFHAEIAASEAQREEWVALHAIDEAEGEQADLTRPAYSEPLTPEFVAANPTLMVDTRHFDEGFTARLLEAMEDLDERTDGVLFHSENFQALSLMQAKYREQVKCVYIDPPYNTGNDGFAYKDDYQHASWLSMANGRLELSDRLLTEDSATFISTDETEAARLWLVVSSLAGLSRPVTNIIWQKVDSPNDNKVPITPDHEYITCLTPRGAVGHLQQKPDRSILKAYRTDPDTGDRYRDRLLKKNGANSLRTDRPTMFFPLKDPDGNDVLPLHDDGVEACWALGRSAIRELTSEGRLIWKRRTVAGVERWEPYTREFPPSDPSRPFPTIWTNVKTMRQAKSQMRKLFGGLSPFETVKPHQLVEQLHVLCGDSGSLTLDYFAGSGTTGHAVINLNREDGGRRKFILVEMGEYFDTVLLPRLKKVTFTPAWKNGKPKRTATPEEGERGPRMMKVVRLESYEDTLNNLVTRRTDAQQDLLDHADAKGPDGFREDYLLRYMLDVETRESPSLLNVQAFADPTGYRLKVKRPGSDESREVNVDLLETFNWLIGLRVERLRAPERFTAETHRDEEGRLRLEDDLSTDPDGPFWLRAVTGTLPDERRALVVWRRLTGDPERDNLVLDAWFARQGYAGGDVPFDLVYVNGGSNLGNERGPEETWRVRLIEEEFLRAMFAAEAG